MANRMTPSSYRVHALGEPPPQPGTPRRRGPMLFAASAAPPRRARTVVLVDGVDLLVDIDGAPDLAGCRTSSRRRSACC